MPLMEKRMQWLRAALAATAREGPVFKRATLRASLRLPIEESSEIAAALQRDGLVTLLSTDEAILTDRGKQVACSIDPPPARGTTDGRVSRAMMAALRAGVAGRIVPA